MQRRTGRHSNEDRQRLFCFDWRLLTSLKRLVSETALVAAAIYFFSVAAACLGGGGGDVFFGGSVSSRLVDLVLWQQRLVSAATSSVRPFCPLLENLCRCYRWRSLWRRQSLVSAAKPSCSVSSRSRRWFRWRRLRRQRLVSGATSCLGGLGRRPLSRWSR